VNITIAVSLITSGSTLLGGLIGSVTALKVQSKQLREKGRDAQATRRREAYAAFILALDRLQRIWEAPETLEYRTEKVVDISGQAVGLIQHEYVAVLLVGSERAKQAALKAHSAAWDLSNLHGGSRGDLFKKDLQDYLDKFRDAAREFVAVAENESTCMRSRAGAVD
jgi:hypothetical protein